MEVRFLSRAHYTMITNPSFSIEQEYWSQDILHIAGLDEAGMGALAGPVVAAAVVFSQEQAEAFQKETVNIPVRDSKLLSARQREKAADLIRNRALCFAIGSASVEEIDSMNIRNASHLAMRRAIEGLTIEPAMLLIDGTSASIHPTIFSLSLIKGDQLSYSIAAASILAKVTRDAILQKLDVEFPAYGFASHKGYGAAIHMAALKEHGATAHHRKSYAPVARALETLTKS